MITRIAGLALLAGLAACNEVHPSTQSIPPTSAGTAAPLARREAQAIAGANSPNASAGVASISGTLGNAGTGRPNVVYSGAPVDASGAGSGTTQSPITANPTVRRGSNN